MIAVRMCLFDLNFSKLHSQRSPRTVCSQGCAIDAYISGGCAGEGKVLHGIPRLRITALCHHCSPRRIVRRGLNGEVNRETIACIDSVISREQIDRGECAVAS